MRIHCHLSVCLILVILLTSCGEENINSEHKQYYDIAYFFKQESVALQKNKMKIVKQIIKDGAKDLKTFDNINWQKELKPFADCDINKPAWINSYLTDTITLKNGGITITYTAKEEKLPVRRIKISFTNENLIEDIVIRKERHNFYYRSDDWFVYRAMKGFEIKGSQKVHFLDETIYEISAIFIP